MVAILPLDREFQALAEQTASGRGEHHGGTGWAPVVSAASSDLGSFGINVLSSQYVSS